MTGTRLIWFSGRECVDCKRMRPIVKKFEEEIQGLERELRTELPKEIQQARELGDLSENAEYQAAKERQRLIDARIGMLKKRVGEISLLNLDKLPIDKVGLGSIVHVTDPTCRADVAVVESVTRPTSSTVE